MQIKMETFEKLSYILRFHVFLGNKMRLRFRIMVSDLGITKTVVAILVVVLILAASAISYCATLQLSSQNASPTPTPSSKPADSPTPTFAFPTPSTPTPTPTTTGSANPTPTTSPLELTMQDKIRDSAMGFIKSNHPETAQFIKDLVWTGGRVTPQDLVGAETFMYYSSGWNFTISYPVIPNPTYTITADYSAPEIGIPYRVIWQGTSQNQFIKENSYTFAQ
jgi:hypothetical protein